jgi:hypothetical protein
MCQPWRTTTIWASMACYKDSFTTLPYHSWSYQGHVTRCPQTSAIAVEKKCGKDQSAVEWIKWCLKLYSTSHLYSVCASQWNQRFLFCEPLKETKIGADIITVVNKLYDSNSSSWDLTKATCTDSTPVTLRKHSWSVALIMTTNPSVDPSHRILYRHDLSLKTLASYLKYVLDAVIQAVNLIWTRILNHLVFEELCGLVWTHHTSASHRSALVIKRKSSN